MTQHRFFALMTLATSALFAPLSFSQPEPAELELIEVQDDLYVIYNDIVPGNVTALITDAGVLLVDNKFAWDYENIMAELATVTDQPVRYVINTHYHGDHTGGNVPMQEDGVQVVASENARLKMIEAEQPGLPGITIDERGYVHLGGKTAELYHFGRAHTDGDVVVYLPEHEVLIAGDMFTYGENVPQLIDYSGGGSARAWTRTLDEALKLDFETVIPGHGRVTTKSVMRDFRDSTVELRVRVREMMADNASRAEIAQMLRDDFNWADLHIDRGLDGMLVELQ